MFSEAKQVGETQGEAPAVKAAKGEEVVTLVWGLVLSFTGCMSSTCPSSPRASVYPSAEWGSWQHPPHWLVKIMCVCGAGGLLSIQELPRTPHCHYNGRSCDFAHILCTLSSGKFPLLIPPAIFWIHYFSNDFSFPGILIFFPFFQNSSFLCFIAVRLSQISLTVRSQISLTLSRVSSLSELFPLGRVLYLYWSFSLIVIFPPKVCLSPPVLLVYQ